MTVIQFTGDRDKEDLVKGAANFAAVQIAVVDAFKELYKIVWASPEPGKTYPDEWNIDLRRGVNETLSDMEKGDARFGVKVARGLRKLPKEEPWPKITIGNRSNWSGEIKANQPEATKGLPSFITVRCYLRLVVDVEENKIIDAYMYPMFVGEKFRARRGEKGELTVKATTEIQGREPEGIPADAEIVDFAVEAQRKYEMFRFPQKNQEVKPEDNPQRAFKYFPGDFYVGGRHEELRKLKEAIVEWCGNEYNSRFARKLNLPNPPPPPAEQVAQVAGGGPLPDTDSTVHGINESLDEGFPMEVDGAGSAAQPTDEDGEAAEGRMEVDGAGSAASPDPQQGESFSPPGDTGGIRSPIRGTGDRTQPGSPVHGVRRNSLREPHNFRIGTRY